MEDMEEVGNDLTETNRNLMEYIEKIRKENDSLVAKNNNLNMQNKHLIMENQKLTETLRDVEKPNIHCSEDNSNPNLQIILPQGSDLLSQDDQWTLFGNVELLNQNTEIDLIFSVIGQYQVGKTFLLSKISEIPINNGIKFPTTTLNFYEFEKNGKNYLSIDTPGSFKPSEFINFDYSKIKLKDLFCKNFTIRMSKIILNIVNNFTIFDQKYLHKISESPSFTSKTFIIVHNFKDICDLEDLSIAWQDQILNLYKENQNEKNYKKTIETIINGQSLKNKIFVYNKNFFQHVCLMNNNCRVGREYNLSSLTHIRNIMEYKEKHSQKTLISRISSKLKLLLSEGLELYLEENKSGQASCEIKFQKTLEEEIKFKNYFWLLNSHQKLRSSSLYMDKYLFRVAFDMPGTSRNDFTIICSNEFTQVSSERSDEGHQISVKSGKRFNDVCIKFKVPKMFNHMNPHYSFKNGVLELQYHLSKPTILPFRREEYTPLTTSESNED